MCVCVRDACCVFAMQEDMQAGVWMDSKWDKFPPQKDTFSERGSRLLL